MLAYLDPTLSGFSAGLRADPFCRVTPRAMVRADRARPPRVIGNLERGSAVVLLIDPRHRPRPAGGPGRCSGVPISLSRRPMLFGAHRELVVEADAAGSKSVRSLDHGRRQIARVKASPKPTTCLLLDALLPGSDAFVTTPARFRAWLTCLAGASRTACGLSPRGAKSAPTLRCWRSGWKDLPPVNGRSPSGESM